MTKVDGWYNDDPPEHEIEKVEIVPLDEASMEDYPGPDENVQKTDEFGAPIRPPVKVRDGVRDTRSR